MKIHFSASAKQYPTWEALRKHINGTAVIAGHRNSSENHSRSPVVCTNGLHPTSRDVAGAAISQLASQIARSLWRAEEQQKRELG